MESGRCLELLESGIADLEKVDLVCSGIVNRVLAVVVETCKPQAPLHWSLLHYRLERRRRGEGEEV